MKILAAVVAALVVAGCSDSAHPGPSEFDSYQKLCHDKGGVVSSTNVGWSTVTYQCIGDSPTPLLPQFSDP